MAEPRNGPGAGGTRPFDAASTPARAAGQGQAPAGESEWQSDGEQPLAGDSLSEGFARTRLGQTLRGKYQLEQVLGVGGMAAVYAARHRNRKQFAIKMLHPELSCVDSIRQRFLREGYVANSVEHPGAVSVLDDDVAEDGSAFLVMELLEGLSLEQLWSQSGGRLPAQTVLAIAWQVLDVLGAAHLRGVVHRDLKPANLFLTRGGAVKVLDFGIARLRDSNQKLTSAGAALGTPAFMPPEQVLGNLSEVDALSDIWAVGASLFVLLSGQLVHEGANSQQLLINAATRKPRSLAQVQPDLPEGLVELVDRALAFERALRWPSANSMRAAVERVHRQLFQSEVSAVSLASLDTCVSPAGDGAPAGVGPTPPAQQARSRSRVERQGRAAAAAPPPPAPASPVPPRPAAAELSHATPAGVASPPRAAAHVEVNIAQVQSGRASWPVMALALVALGAITALVWQRGATPAELPAAGSSSASAAPAPAVTARAAAAIQPAPAVAQPAPAVAPPAPAVAPPAPAVTAPAPAVTATEPAAAAKHEPAMSSSAAPRQAAPRPAPAAPRGSRPASRELSPACTRLLERQSLGEALNAQEKIQLSQQCKP